MKICGKKSIKSTKNLMKKQTTSCQIIPELVERMSFKKVNFVNVNTSASRPQRSSQYVIAFAWFIVVVVIL